MELKGTRPAALELRRWVRLYCNPDSATANERTWLARNPIEGWDVSQVTDMSCLFFGERLFNADISRWDVSRVTDMHSMFCGARAFNQPLEAWNVSRVTNMQSMFEGAAAFNQPIGAWDVRAVTSMEYMFHKAHAFNQPIGGWNMSCVLSVFRMLVRADAFQQWIEPWSMSGLADPWSRQDDTSHIHGFSNPFHHVHNRCYHIAGVDLEWHLSHRGRQFEQWVRAHDMVVLLRRSIHQTFLWRKLPEELSRMVGQWLGLEW
jgi:surface protein